MSEPAVDKNVNAILRDMAETRLKSGTAGIAGNYSLGIDALNLLHRLSSHPDSAADALQLLHELQVHQVEIDLQNEVMQDNGNKLVNEIAHFRELYEHAPVAYYVMDFQGRILTTNRAGTELFHARRDDINGALISRFLSAESQFVLNTMLHKLRQGDTGIAGEVLAEDNGSNSPPLRLVANLSADQRFVLLVCYPIL